ncbi:FBD-associated F-box protein At5g60610-like [Carex rostrata]
MKKAKISSEENCDFISRLPDPILYRILGLLRIKEAIQTCVLSKRWEHLWTSLPSLNFNFDYDSDYDPDEDSDGNSAEDYADEMSDYSAKCERFPNFVNAVLLRRKPLDLDVFQLFCYYLSNNAEMHWIRYAMNHNVRVLHLSPYEFIPWSTYTCASLQKLYLYSPHRDLDNLDSSLQRVNLPNLKKLSICCADLLNSNYVNNFLGGCPKLEFLLIDTCKFTDCIIAHDNLEYLVLVRCLIEDELFVSAPNLLQFFYRGELSLPCKTTLNMPSLASSRLTSCDPPFMFLHHKEETSWVPSIIKCLEGMATCLRFLTNVELLELHFEYRQYKEFSASVSSLELPIFPYLKNVTVAFCMFSCFQMVTWIMKSSPKLKTLTILQNRCVSHSEEGDCSHCTNESTNVSSTIAISPHKKLKIVEVKYWRYNQMVRQLADALMDCTKEFENLKICWSKYKSSRQYLN